MGNRFFLSCPWRVLIDNLDHGCRSRRGRCRTPVVVWPCFRLRTRWRGVRGKRHLRRRGWGLVDILIFLAGGGSWSRRRLPLVPCCMAGCYRCHWNGRWWVANWCLQLSSYAKIYNICFFYNHTHAQNSRTIWVYLAIEMLIYMSYHFFLCILPSTMMAAFLYARFFVCYAYLDFRIANPALSQSWLRTSVLNLGHYLGLNLTGPMLNVISIITAVRSSLSFYK